MSRPKKNTALHYTWVSICLSACIWVTNPSYGQSKDTRLEIEADPLAYLFNGYSLHTAVTYSGFRSSLGVFGIKPPGFLLENDAFSVYTSGYDFKTDYFFGAIKGFYTGLQLTYTQDKIELREGQEGTDTLRGLNLGVRAGYRFLFGKKENSYKGFYLTPWVALMYNPSPKTIQQGSAEYRQASWIPFPTIHVGWRF